MIGKTVGKYRIAAHLGTGGMGTVYKAIDQTLERDVAIKVLNRGLTDERMLKRFRAEATTLAKLNHPAIATIFELFEFEGEFLIVMEFVPGETLENLALREGVLPIDQTVFLIDQILSALAHTHRAGIVHCDIKPANVMVTAEGGAKMMDFGTARVRGAEPLTVRGYLMGTPTYMPPEQLLGQHLDARSDLYSVGVVLYRLLSGMFPFAGDTPIETMRKQISDAPTPLRTHRRDLPAWCDRLISRALAKAPEDRFQTADEFRTALHDAMGLASADMPKPIATAAAQPGAPVVHDAAPRRASGNTLVLPAGASRRFTRPFVGIAAVAATMLSAATLRAPTVPASLPVPPAIPLRMPAPLAVPAVPPGAFASSPIAAGAAASPFLFEAKLLTGDDRHRERKCRVVLANGRLAIRPDDSAGALDTFDYDQIAAIAYSRGRDPLWRGPSGTTAVRNAGGGPLSAFGIFTKREWLALRLAPPHARFVVLRFENATEARRAIAAVEARTGRRVDWLAPR